MSTQTYEFSAGPGLTINCKLFLLGGDTAIDLGNATEKTNDSGRYTVQSTDLAGAYRMNGFVDDNGGYVNETFDPDGTTGTFYPRSEQKLEVPNGNGPYRLTVPIQNDAEEGLAGARVSILGTTLKSTTGVSGLAQFNVDGAASPGIEYTIRVSAPSGYSDPEDVTVTVLQIDKTANVIVLESVPAGVAPETGKCLTTVKVITQHGNLPNNATIVASATSKHNTEATIVNETTSYTTTNGVVVIPLLKGVVFKITITYNGVSQSFSYTASTEDSAEVTFSV